MRFVGRTLMVVGFGWIGLSMAFFFWLAIWATLFMGAPWIGDAMDFFFVILISAIGGIMNGLPGLGLILIGAVLARVR